MAVTGTGCNNGQDALVSEVARSLGAGRVWLLTCGASKVLEEAVHLSADDLLVRPLDGMPVRCVDMRELAAQARKRGATVVADCTRTGVSGCAANRLGAHVCVAELGDSSCVVGVSRDGMRMLPELAGRLDGLQRELFELLPHSWSAMLDDSRRMWHEASDAAQVVASYLRCHPRVDEVRYPGLRDDPSFGVAARTLTGGFGPCVDWRPMGGGAWRRIVCRDGDPLDQVMELEQALSREVES